MFRAVLPYHEVTKALYGELRLINKPITGWVADKHTYRLTVRLVDWPQN